MKRFACCAILAVLLGFLLGVMAFATSNIYELSDLGMQLSIPTDYWVVTRDTPEDDPVFAYLGITKDDIAEEFETGCIYLDAISISFANEIVVTSVDVDMNDFDNMADTVILSLADTFAEEFVSYGFDMYDYDVYQNVQGKFLRACFTDASKTIYAQQYYTVCGGKSMGITLRSYSGSFSDSDSETLKAIVDSIQYNTTGTVSVPETETESVKDAEGFEYTDQETGVRFTIPENWEQEEFSKPRSFLDCKFVSTEELGLAILYGSTDLWSQMSETEKLWYSREDIDNSIFTESEIAQLLDLIEDEVSTVIYNGIEYYQIQTTQSAESYGINLTMTMTQLLYVNNGWLYSFQFNGGSNDSGFSIFESTVNSVIYPQSEEAAEPEETEPSMTYNNVEEDTPNSSGSVHEEDTPNSDGGVLEEEANETFQNSQTDQSSEKKDAKNIPFVVVLAGIAVIVMVILAIRKNRAKKMGSYIAAQESYRYCSNCGQAIPAESLYCHICGARVI